jgi:transcriptional regulator with XRE-family HTH domain
MRKVADKSCIALSYVSEIERGRKEISSELLKDLAKGLGHETHEVILLAGYRLGGLDKAPNAPLIDEYGDLVVAR